MRLSWSSMQSFLSCQRRYELHYIEGLSKLPSADKYNVMLGSAFHAGIQTAIVLLFNEPKSTDKDLVRAAKNSVVEYLDKNTIENKRRYNWEQREYEHDIEYYEMITQVRWAAQEMIEYYLPRIGLGSRYLPTTTGEVLGYTKGDEEIANSDIYGTSELHNCAVEWKFEYLLNSEDTLTGIIDTVLWDTVEEEFVLVDWKTRSLFPQRDLALVDGQLPLYAAVLNSWGARISKVIMWQFLTTTPRPASISKRNNQPNMGAESYNTTWEVWKATLPAGLKAEHYEEEIKPKLKQNSDFQDPVASVVTAESSKMAFDNVYVILDMIKNAVAHNKASGLGMAAVLGSNACKFCDFLKLCANPLRYGGDMSEMIEREYIKSEED